MLPIAISLSPNAEREDVLRALFLLFRPWRWICRHSVIASAAKQSRHPSANHEIATGSRSPRNDIRALESEFKQYFGVPYAWSFNSGRSALYTLLKALGIGAGDEATARRGDAEEGADATDEVLLQAFTCNAVPNPVLWVGAKPVYVDIERDTYNIDPTDLEKKITPRSKVLIIQHTFGIPAGLERILPIARAHNLFVIEDCAHALGATFPGALRHREPERSEGVAISSFNHGIASGSPNPRNDGLVGTFGDAAFFSFGRDKVISSVYGGMLITKNHELAQKIEAEYKKLSYPSHFWVFQQLLHPIVFAFALPLYNFFGLGKFIIRSAQQLRLLSKAVTEGERRGVRPSFMPACLPEALAALALGQFRRLEKSNDHRRKIAQYYAAELTPFVIASDPERVEGERGNLGVNGETTRLLRSFTLPRNDENATPVWLRFPIQHPRAAEIIREAHKHGIYLGDWYREVIAPAGTDLQKMCYEQVSCPVAEEVARRIINLPTYPRLSLREAERIAAFLKEALPFLR